MPPRIASAGFGVRRGRLPGATPAGWLGIGARLRAARGWNEPGAGHHRRAVGPVARGRREQIAPAVGGADIGGVGFRVRVRRAGAQPLVHRAEFARRRHLGPRLVRPDQLRALGGVFRRHQRRQRHIADSRVGVIGLAVGKGEFQRLGQRVDIVGAVMAERLRRRCLRAAPGFAAVSAPGTTRRRCTRRDRRSGAARAGRPANGNSPCPRPRAARPGPE